MNPRNACIAISIFLISCSSPAVSGKGLSTIGFTAPPSDVIEALEKSRKGYAEHFMLGVAYKKEARYKDAMRNFANSCFTSHRDLGVRLFPQPVYQLVNGFHLKSPYYNDAVYEIADLFSRYGEHAYVIKFIELMSRDRSALYRNGQILKARSLDELKNYDESLSVLRRLLERYDDRSSRSLILLRIGSVFEKKQDLAGALNSYLSVLKENPRSWQSASAAGLSHVLVKKNVRALTSAESLLLSRALYFSKRYADAAAMLEEMKPGPGEKTDTLSFLVRSLAREKRNNDVERILHEHQLDAELTTALIAAYADELWSMGDRNRALVHYDSIIIAGSEPHAQEALYRTARFMEERKMAGFDQKIIAYKDRYSDDRAGHLLWLLGRALIRDRNATRARACLEEAVSSFPEGSHSDECRFWLHKLYADAGENDRALKTAQDIARFNPDSPYTWLLMKQSAENQTESALLEGYKKAGSDKNMTAALYFHFLLFIRERSMQKRDIRIADLGAPDIGRYNDLEQAIDRMKISSGYGGALTDIEKYFIIGYDAGISRELALLPKSAGARRDRHIALAHYGRKYSHAHHEVYSFLELLKLYRIKENIALMPERSVAALFPEPFRQCVQSYGRVFSVKPEVLYSVMKAESLFNHRAVSSAGATGLMQLMPATARGLARELKIDHYDLTDPCTSIQFGAKYISWLIGMYDGNFPYVVAAYNAGAGNVNKWIDNMGTADMDYFTEFTPFIETRYYILRTGKFLTQYQILGREQAPVPAD
ncbi:MAG: transglycosylase SLT domain-containing protein [Spirochaetes bacterium]|nr:transglycosylase SLT domain-containing protein [Spirochaetota bacterium]